MREDSYQLYTATADGQTITEVSDSYSLYNYNSFTYSYIITKMGIIMFDRTNSESYVKYLYKPNGSTSFITSDTIIVSDNQNANVYYFINNNEVYGVLTNYIANSTDATQSYSRYTLFTIDENGIVTTVNSTEGPKGSCICGVYKTNNTYNIIIRDLFNTYNIITANTLETLKTNISNLSIAGSNTGTNPIATIIMRNQELNNALITVNGIINFNNYLQIPDLNIETQTYSTSSYNYFNIKSSVITNSNTYIKVK